MKKARHNHEKQTFKTLEQEREFHTPQIEQSPEKHLNKTTLLFEKTLFNFLKKKKTEKIDTQNLIESFQSQQFPPEIQIEQKLEALHLLQSSQGRKIHTLLKYYTGETATKIKQFLSIGESHFQQIFQTQNSSPLLQFSNLPLPFSSPININQIYEQIIQEDLFTRKKIEISESSPEEILMGYINQRRKERKISNKPLTKRRELITATFQQNPREMLHLFIDDLGFIPEMIFNEMLFTTQTNGFPSIANFYKHLINKERYIKKQKNSQKKLFQIRLVRDLIIKHIFKDVEMKKKGKTKTIKGIAHQAKNPQEKQVKVDTNGVWINLVKKGKGIDSHYPFADITPELLEYWTENSWITEGEKEEISKQVALENNDQRTVDENIKHQIESCITGFKKLNTPTQETDNMLLELGNEGKLTWLALNIFHSPEEAAKTVIKNDIFIPNEVFESLIHTLPSSNSIYENYYKLFLFAEAIMTQISKQGLFDKKEMLETYSLAQRVQRNYKNRLRHLKHHKQYNGFKAIQCALETGLPKNDPEKGFLTFTGEYKTNNYKQNFIEILFQGKLTRVLLAPGKHLPKEFNENLKQLPSLKPKKFENYELLMRSYALNRKALTELYYYEGQLSAFINAESPTSDIHSKFSPSINTETQKTKKDLIQKFQLQAQSILNFVLNYSPEHFKELKNHLSAILQEISTLSQKSNIKQLTDSVQKFLSFSEDIFKTIENNFSTYLEKEHTVENSEINIKKRALTFDENYLSAIQDNNLPDWAYSHALSNSKEQIQIVEIHNPDKSQASSTNYMSELQAIDSLKLIKNRPLIVISGGCKELTKDKENPLEILGKTICKIGHEQRANIAIPCTQSGIGNILSKKNIEYKNDIQGMRPENCMKMFAIAPAVNMFDPQNTLMSKDNPEVETFAPSVVDQIYIPCEAGWDIQDKSIIHSEYPQFVEQAESIYNRLDHKQNRIHIVGNGSLWSMAEINASLKNNAQIIILEDTGRFADAAASILKNPSILHKLTMESKILGDFNSYNDYFQQIEAAVQKNMNPEDFEIWKKNSWGETPSPEDNERNIQINSFYDKDNEKNYFNVATSSLSVNTSTTPKHILYRGYFEEFLNLVTIAKKKPIICSVNNLDKTLKDIA